MDEYIKRKPLIEEINSLSVTLCGKELFGELAKHSVVQIIDAQPTADVVEVVRCKDCVSSEMYEFGCSGVERMACVEKEDGVVRFAQAVDPMGYCSSGKRKDGAVE
jgi:hypothetical protein